VQIIEVFKSALYGHTKCIVAQFAFLGIMNLNDGWLNQSVWTGCRLVWQVKSTALIGSVSLARIYQKCWSFFAICILLS